MTGIGGSLSRAIMIASQGPGLAVLTHDRGGWSEANANGAALVNEGALCGGPPDDVGIALHIPLGPLAPRPGSAERGPRIAPRRRRDATGSRATPSAGPDRFPQSPVCRSAENRARRRIVS
jgi:hypothetical protein